MSVVHGGTVTHSLAGFEISGRALVAVHAEGRQVTLEQVNLLVALGTPPPWALTAQEIATGLRFAPDLSPERIVHIATEPPWAQAMLCTVEEVPMKARSPRPRVRAAAAGTIAGFGEPDPEARLLAKDADATVRHRLAGRKTPKWAAMVLAADAEPGVVAALAFAHDDPDVLNVALRRLGPRDIWEYVEIGHVVPPDLWGWLARHDSAKIRAAAARRTDVPRPLVAGLADDRDPDVAQAALRALRNRAPARPRQEQS